jgi:hypothetical protein
MRILVAGVFFLLIVLTLAIVLGVAVGVGWLLTRLLPFTLFEGTLLGLLASVIVGAFWINVLRSVARWSQEEAEEDEEDFYYDEIPPDRFFKTGSEKTWETWLHYEFANDIYVEFQDYPQRIAPTGDRQLQELAVRLAEVAVAILKTKPPRTKRLHLSPGALKQQLIKMGQRPYDDDILNLAAEVINDYMSDHQPELLWVIGKKLWDESPDLYTAD